MALLQKGYLGATPLFKDLAWFEESTSTLVSSGSATATGSSTAHVKGSWAQIIASTSANATALIVSVYDIGANGVNTAVLLDIGFGASGSETVKIADIAVGGAAATSTVPFGGLSFVVPFQVPSGTRIAARIQGVVTSETAAVFIQAVSTDDYTLAPTSVDTIGTNTANSEGLGMSGASGTWVQATASTSNAYRGIVIIPSLAATTGITSLDTRFDVGVGASASEAQFGFVNVRYVSNETVTTGILAATSVLGKKIAAGSRLAVRHQLSSNQGLYQVTLLGIR